MNGKKGWLAISLTVLLMFSAAPGASNREVLLDELYEQAGLEQQLRWIKASMALDYSRYGLPVEVLDAFNLVIKVRYGTDYFRRSMMGSLAQSLTVEELLALVEWYNSPLGQKILQLETIANNPINAHRVEKYIDERLAKQLPRSSRATLINELMVTMDVVEHSTELAATAAAGAHRLLREIMPGALSNNTPDSPQALKAREKPTIRRGIQKKMKGILFYTYRSLSDQEIERYLAFTRTSAMQNFQRGQVQAIAKMM